MNTTQTMAPAIVHGNDRRATAYFIQDSNGDLVDIEFVCTYHTDPAAGALPWPAFEFSSDYNTCCRECGGTIHTAGE